MFLTYVTVYRPEGTVLTGSNGQLAQHLSVQVDRASDQEKEQAKSAWEWHGSYLFKVFTMHRYPQFTLNQDDVLIDELNLDPDTNYGYKYKLINRPKLYPDKQLAFADTTVGL